MSPTLLALKAAVVLAATDAKAAAKKAKRPDFHAGRLDAFREVLRLIETVNRLEEGTDE